VCPLALPPDDLGRFPTYRLEARRRLYRVHRADNAPVWFSSDGSGRFDLTGDRGTLYLAVSELGALIEVFRSGTLVAEAEVAARRLSTIAFDSAVGIADAAIGRARAYGITAEIHSSPDYELTQAWARGLASAGFAGIRYRLRHDPAQREIGIALFGASGEDRSIRAEATDVIAEALTRRLARRFGITVTPTPG
jgi:hypothetical protein